MTQEQKYRHIAEHLLACLQAVQNVPVHSADGWRLKLLTMSGIKTANIIQNEERVPDPAESLAWVQSMAQAAIDARLREAATGQVC